MDKKGSITIKVPRGTVVKVGNDTIALKDSLYCIAPDSAYENGRIMFQNNDNEDLPYFDYSPTGEDSE